MQMQTLCMNVALLEMQLVPTLVVPAKCSKLHGIFGNKTKLGLPPLNDCILSLKNFSNQETLKDLFQNP